MWILIRITLRDNRLRNLVLAIAVFCLISCSSIRPIRLPDEVIQYDLPNLIVGEFEYKGALKQIPNVGSGFRDALIDKMIEKRYFHVLNRKGLSDTITEFELQSLGLTRLQGRIKPAKVKNARYIVRGVITEFATRMNASFIAEALLGVVGLEARSDLISLQLMIEDLQTNQVIISEAITESKTSGSVSYQNITFGSQIFWDSPLGEATAEALGETIDYLIEQLPKNKWYASVIPLGDQNTFSVDDRIIVSGGIERGMTIGSQWQLVQKGQKLIDPNTYDDAGFSPDIPKDALVLLQEVNNKNAYGVVVKGTLKAGDTLVLKPFL